MTVTPVILPRVTAAGQREDPPRHRGVREDRTERLCRCLRQELFQKCHPVHFLNSRALGVMDKSVAIPK